jgi:hypothetical protein
VPSSNNWNFIPDWGDFDLSLRIYSRELFGFLGYLSVLIRKDFDSLDLD